MTALPQNGPASRSALVRLQSRSARSMAVRIAPSGYMFGEGSGRTVAVWMDFRLWTPGCRARVRCWFTSLPQ